MSQREWIWKSHFEWENRHCHWYAWRGSSIPVDSIWFHLIPVRSQPESSSIIRRSLGRVWISFDFFWFLQSAQMFDFSNDFSTGMFDWSTLLSNLHWSLQLIERSDSFFEIENVLWIQSLDLEINSQRPFDCLAYTSGTHSVLYCSLS